MIEQSAIDKMREDWTRLQELIHAFGIETQLLHEYAGDPEPVSLDRGYFWRRIAVRMVFAQVEGLSYALKQAALSTGPVLGVTFDTKEIALLKEESYSLDDRGRAQQVKARLSTLPSLRFALDMFVRSTNANHSVTYSDEGWQSLKRTETVRNRLTHPKNLTDRVVSDEEFSDAYTALKWVLQSGLKHTKDAADAISAMVATRPPTSAA